MLSAGSCPAARVLRGWRFNFPLGVFGLLVCGVIGVLTIWNTNGNAHRLEDDQLPLYERALKLKWLHYKVLELATRSSEKHELFFSLYASSLADMKTELEWMINKAQSIGDLSLAEMLDSLQTMNGERISQDQASIDGEECTQWGSFDCGVPVPGVASNVDVTVFISDGQAACDDVDSQGGGICQWIPDRPDEVPEPQPPNLLNKCVCYACKGPLPSPEYDLPPEYRGSSLGTDAKYQCEHDPHFADRCYWDGLNCIPRQPLPDTAILNSTEYMDRFDRIAAQFEHVEARILDDIHTDIAEAMDLSEVSVIATEAAAALYAVLLLTFTLWHARPGNKLRFGLAFYTMIGLFLLMGLAFFVFVAFTGTHMRELWITLRDTELVMDKVAWNIIFYDAILTTSASRFVMTAHKTGWIDEDYTGVPGGVRVYDYWFINYIETVGNLDAAINYAVDHAVSAEEQQIFKTIGTVNKILVDLEQIALCSCEPPDASALPANDTTLGITSMYSVTYLQAKETYNQQNMNFLRVQMQRLLVKVRELQSKAELMLIMLVTMMVFIPVSLTEIARQIMARKRQRQMEYDLRQQRLENVLSNTVDLLAHPLITITADVFLTLGAMIRHESARSQRLLTFSDSPREAIERFVLFVSHQWLGAGEPDPTGVQFQATCSAIRRVAQIHDMKESMVHVWLDYHSIPQYNGVAVGVGVSAVASLVNYAMYSSAMCVIAPAATHSGNGRICNFSTYMSRGWCRAEQAGYMLRNGTRNLYIQDETGFRMAASESMENYEAFFPMEGTFTCCLWKHPDDSMCDRERLVDVMIYLYYAAKQLGDDEAHKFVYDLVMKNKGRIFPKKFVKTTQHSALVRKDLFGNLLEQLDSMLAHNELHVHSERKKGVAGEIAASANIGDIKLAGAAGCDCWDIDQLDDAEPNTAGTGVQWELDGV